MVSLVTPPNLRKPGISLLHKMRKKPRKTEHIMLIVRNILATILCTLSLLLSYTSSINNFYRWDDIPEVVRVNTIINLPFVSFVILATLTLLWLGKLDKK